MPTFTYQARDAKGERVSGSHEAADQRAALEALRATGLFVTKLEVLKNGAAAITSAPPSTPAASELASTLVEASLPSKKWQMAASENPVETPAPKPSTPARRAASPELSPLSPVSSVEKEARVPTLIDATSELPPRYWLRANSKELSLFFRQMNAMLHAGVSLGHALNTMANSAPSKGLREACGEMSTRVSGGKQFSELMKSFPGIFTPLMAGMIRAGELGGFLDRMCLRLAEYSERDYEIQQTIKRETWYPKMLVFASFFIPSLVPAAIAIFLGGGNPFVIWFRAFIVPAVVMLTVFLLFKFKNFFAPLFKHIAPLVYLFDQIKLYIPIAGKTTRALATAKFCRALGALQSAGMGVQQTINLAADACGNAVIAETSRKTIRQIEAGSGLTDALASTGQFPGVAIQMMRTGEETGNFDEQLGKVADFLEGDAETTIKQSVALLGILIFLGVAGYIGLQVVKQYAGYGAQVDQMINEAN